MPTLILPNGQPRWVELASHSSFIQTLETFYSQYTASIDEAWNKHVVYLRKHGVVQTAIDRVDEFIRKSFEASPLLAQHGHKIRGCLVDANANTWKQHLFAYDAIPDEIEVPLILDNIAQLYHSERSCRTGKGEFLIPLLFKDAVWNSHEAVYDVTINGQNWHVKAVKRRSESAKLNMCGYANGRICKTLSTFMSASQLSAGKKRQTGLLANLNCIKALPWFDDCINDKEVVNHFQQLIDDEMRTLSIGDAMGIIFYVEPERRFIFKKKDEVYCAGATQSNHVATITPNFFASARCRILATELRTAEKTARRKARLEKTRLRQERLAAHAAAKLAERRERDRVRIVSERDKQLAREFLVCIRRKWQAATKGPRAQRAANPSFDATVRQFAKERSLDYKYFYSYLMDNSTCRKTFSKLMIRCP
jgi:hypothetical protein